jgi:hypothetical protein
MDNFDQLDRFVTNNTTLIKHIIVFVVSTFLILLVCVLAYSMILGTKTMNEQRVAAEKEKETLQERVGELRALQAIEQKRREELAKQIPPKD